MAAAMCRHFGLVAATLHRAPAPGARSRGVDEGNRTVDALAAPDPGRELASDNLDHVAGHGREECCCAGRGLHECEPSGSRRGTKPGAVANELSVVRSAAGTARPSITASAALQ